MLPRARLIRTTQARVLVEDAKVGIIKYIKRKSNAIKLAKGFDGLESWALKELSDGSSSFLHPQSQC